MPFKRIFLSGVDYFQLLIDHHAKKKGGPGHEAHLAVYLDGEVNRDHLTQTLESNELVRQLSTIRVSKLGGLGYPSVTFKAPQNGIPLTFHTSDTSTLPSHYLNHSVDAFNGPPLSLQVIYLQNKKTCLLFTFNHILFDFAGVQSFINSLAGMGGIPLLPEKVKSDPFATRFRRFFRAVFFTFREANRHMTIPERKLPEEKKLRINYHEHEFSEDETARLYERMGKSGYGLNRSIPEIASVCVALHQHIFSKQQHHRFIWLPVPVNSRKKGTADAVLFNGLSFLFYKLRPHQLESREEAVAAIKEQMRDQMKREMPRAFTDFADGYWYMPMPFYYPMMQLPSWGKLSSFSFSTLGKTFEGVNELFGCRIINMVNYPSNTITPGITFLFYEYQNKLRIMSSWVEGQYSAEEQRDVMRSVVGGL